MKEKSKKLVRYSTAAAALLAVTGSANAAIVPGKILTSYNGETYDNILDGHDDFVFIDMNNDGIPDFVAYMTSGTSSSPFGSFDTRKVRLYASDNAGANDNYLDFAGSYPRINKFQFNEEIGPLVYPGDNGILASYSEGAPFSPSNSSLSVPFNNSTDEGYIGIQTTLAVTGQQHYGWIHVLIGEDVETTEFIACALETTPEQSILAGSSAVVPLLPIASAAGLGLIGLMAAMKKRRKLTA